MSTVDPDSVAVQIEALIEKLAALGDSPAASQARELVRLLMTLYGAGFSRMLEIVRTEGGGAQAILDRVAAEPLLASLLVLHDLHPQSVQERVERALTHLRPHLPAGTGVAVVVADADAVHLRVDRGSAGRADAAPSLRLALERAVQEAAPEVGTIRVLGLDAPLLQILRPSRVRHVPEQQAD